MTRELDEFLSRVKGARCFVDVGANHGIFSLTFLKINPDGVAFAVDPSPIAEEIRNKNSRLNRMDECLLSERLACGRENGSVSMHVNWHHLEASGVGDEELDKIVVPVRKLDDLCLERQLHPDIVKIDTEGYELHVLQGAEETLLQAKILFLEVHPPMLAKLGVDQREVFDWLRDHAWKVTQLDGAEISRRNFCNRIHTFWTICEKEVDGIRHLPSRRF